MSLHFIDALKRSGCDCSHHHCRVPRHLCADGLEIGLRNVGRNSKARITDIAAIAAGNTRRYFQQSASQSNFEPTNQGALYSPFHASLGFDSFNASRQTWVVCFQTYLQKYKHAPLVSLGSNRGEQHHASFGEASSRLRISSSCHATPETPGNPFCTSPDSRAGPASQIVA